MDLKQRVAEVQRRLEERGVKDIKFVWAPGEHLISHVTEDVCDMLEQYLDGKTTPAPLLNDSVRDESSIP